MDSIVIIASGSIHSRSVICIYYIAEIRVFFIPPFVFDDLVHFCLLV